MQRVAHDPLLCKSPRDKGQLAEQQALDIWAEGMVSVSQSFGSQQEEHFPAQL